ncbi:hypothetical protein K8I61_15605 [bacterium]|nr:hypothetical protein [bacterium]
MIRTSGSSRFVARHGPMLALAACVACYAIAMFSTPGGFGGPDDYRNHDFSIAATHDALARDTILHHHALPGRSHLVGGGYPVAAHPSDGSWSPLILTSLVFGERVGLRLNMLLALFVGGWGVFLLARDRLALSTRAAAFTSLAFALAGWYPSRIVVGFYESTVWLLFPMALALMLAPGGGARRIAVAALVTMTALLQGLGGGAFFLLWVALAIAFGLGDTRAASRRWAIMRVGTVVTVAALLGAVKFVPMADLLRRGTIERIPARIVAMLPADDAERFWFRRTATFYEGVLNPEDPNKFLPASTEAFHYLTGLTPYVSEYAGDNEGGVLPLTSEFGYQGIPVAVLVLALAGAIAGGRAGRGAGLVLFILLWLALGRNAPVDIYRPLHLLPVANGINRPLQYLGFFVTLQAVLAAGIGFSAIERRLADRPRAQIVALVLAVAALLPTAIGGAWRFAWAFSVPLERPAREPEFYQVALDNDGLREQHSTGWGNTYLNVRRGVGSIVWDNNIALPENAQPRYLVDAHGERRPAPGYKGEAYFQHGDLAEGAAVAATQNNVVRDIAIGPSTIRAIFSMTAPGTIVVNQNYDPRWRADVGRVVDAGGLLAVELAQPATQVKLRYRDTPRAIGLAISLATLAGLLATVAWKKRR